jgi:hypothetical protein
MRDNDQVVYAVGKIILEHVGLANAIRREDLVDEVVRRVGKDLATPDRKVRRAIEILRGDRWLIGASASGDGYYKVSTMEEFEEFIKNYTSRAYQVIRNAEQMREGAKDELLDAPQQLSLI